MTQATYALLIPNPESGFDLAEPYRIARGRITLPQGMPDEQLTGYCVGVLGQMYPAGPVEVHICIWKE